ncbi:hypothetical protein LCGC14_0406270 [marine sediment metagenome]|uniref:Uncharacterized protein n=1 Tax=marine sediment metagenome TaxID=412755 RepID=A0A0F9W4G5_9ZZZZ
MQETKQLEEQIKVVAEARQRAQNAVAVKTACQREWVDENKDMLDIVVAVAQEVTEAEVKLRELTLQAYAETGNKAPAVGVGIREVTKLDYDGKVAFDWAKSHKMALKLDVSAFEKIAKADTPDFVKITTEPQATIATELNKVE